MSKKKITIPYFEQYHIDTEYLSKVQLPNKIWSFVDSQNTQPFDLLDITEFYNVDITMSRKILDFLLQHKVCIISKIKDCSYEEWKKANGKTTIAKPKPSEEVTPDTPLKDFSASTDITVNKQAQSISLEIG